MSYPGRYAAMFCLVSSQMLKEVVKAALKVSSDVYPVSTRTTLILAKLATKWEVFTYLVQFAVI